MTQQETRKLGIEFERRLQIMYPNSKYVEKLNSDTIYSILNEYQIKYIKQLYLAQRQQHLGEIGAENVDNVLRALTVNINFNTVNDTFTLPNDFWLYLRSTSNATTHYKPGVWKPTENGAVYTGAEQNVLLSNELIEDKDVNSVINKYHNYAGVIRNPLIIVQGGNAKIIHDLYTTINSVDLVYYKMPVKFDISSTPCELPISAFDDLVSGAIKLYVFEYKFALALSASNSKYNKLKKGVDKLADDNKQEQQ